MWRERGGGGKSGRVGGDGGVVQRVRNLKGDVAVEEWKLVVATKKSQMPETQEIPRPQQGGH